MKRLLLFTLVAAGATAVAYAAGLIPPEWIDRAKAAIETRAGEPQAAPAEAPAPLVTVAKATPTTFVETVLATGTLVPREEILVAPQVDGLRILDLKVDEGDRVEKGQVMATLVPTTLDAELARNDAALAEADAAIAQARSQIVEAEARTKEALAAFERAKPLTKSGYVSQSTYDAREAAARTSEALLVAARDGLKVAAAKKANVEAQRRDVQFRLGNTDVKAPASGVVSRRVARIGAMASMAGEPMFRIIKDGEIELDAEAPEQDLAKMNAGDKARLEVAGVEGEVEGTVRLVSPEVDRATRLGRVRVFLGANPALRIGAFARGRVETSTSQGLAVPAAAVMYGRDGAYVQVLRDGKVKRQPVTLGLAMEDRREVRDGLSEGDLVVAKAGTFLRDGDAARPFTPEPESAESAR